MEYGNGIGKEHILERDRPVFCGRKQNPTGERNCVIPVDTPCRRLGREIEALCLSV